MAKADLSAQQLRALLDYDPSSGIFTWRPRVLELFNGNRRAHAAWNSNFSGKRAGHRRRGGHVTIAIWCRSYFAHCLAWLYVYGHWRENQIDHINGIRDDNRIANLRDVTGKVNTQNQRRRTTGDMALPLGVVRKKGRNLARPFVAGIQVDGKSKHLGYFATAEEAHRAYVEAKRLHHAGCTI